MEPRDQKPPDAAELRADARFRRAVRFLCNVAELTSSLRMPELLVDCFAQNCVGDFCDACVVHALESDGQLARAAIADGLGLGAERVTAAFVPEARDVEGALHDVVRTRQPALYNRKAMRSGAPAESAARLLRTTRTRSLIVVPLVVGARVAGTVSFLEARRTAPYDAFEVSCALAAVRQLGSALEVVEARVREQDAIERSRLRGRATDQLYATPIYREMLARLVNVLAEDFADCAMAVSVAAGDVEVLARADRHGSTADDDGAPTQLALEPISKRALTDALRARRPVLINRISRPAAGLLPAQDDDAEVQSWMTVPLAVDDSTVDAITCYSLRNRFTEADLKLLEEICQRASVARGYARGFERERRLTRTLQQATLPSNLADIPGAIISAIYIPAAQEEQVGGDWYDAFSLDDHRVLVTVGDVTGHGLQASVIMGKLRHVLNVVAMYEMNPVRVLDIAERIVLRRFPDAIATALVAIVDTRSGILTYANAGHPGLIVRFKDGTTRLLAAGGLPVGTRYLGRTSEPQVHDLSNVDLVFMYTDGITESRRLPIEGEACLLQSIENEVAIVVSDSASYVQAVCLDGPADDDVAALSLNFAELQRWRFASDDHKAAQQARRDFRDALSDRGLSGDQRAASELIFGELCANVARHAPGVAEVALDMRGERAVLHVVDRGPGYMVRTATETNILSEGGRGLWLLNRLGAEVSVDVIPRFGTHTRAVLPGPLVTAQRAPAYEAEAAPLPL